MEFKMDKELLKNWTEFHKFAQESLKSQGHASSSAGDTSLFLDLIQKQKLKLYEECGFKTKVTEKLDEIIKKTEQFCLMETIHLYENFKQQREVKHMASCVVKLDRMKELSTTPEKATKTDKKGLKRGHSSRVKTPLSDSGEEEAPATVGNQELGRGKRKKIKKLKFEETSVSDAEEEATVICKGKPRQARKSEVAEKPASDTNKEEGTLTRDTKDNQELNNGKRKNLKSLKLDKTSTSDCDEEDLGTSAAKDNSQLGRGKRKKIKKMKFEFEDEFMVKGTSTPQNVSNTSKRVCHSEPTNKKSPVKANGTTRKGLNGSMAGSKGTPLINLKAKKLGKNDKQSSLKKPSEIEKTTHKSPEKSKQDLSPTKTKVEKGEGTANLDMSLDAETSLVDKTTSGPITDSADCIKANDFQQAVTESPPDALGAESSVEKVNDKGLSTCDLTQSGMASKNEKPTKAIGFRRVRGPQKGPKKLPLNKVPMVCARCKTRFAAYSTLRRHWDRVHSDDEKFDPTNPPKHLLCIETGKEFSFVNLYLKHYRALLTPASSNQKHGPGSDKQSENGDKGEPKENATRITGDNVSTGEDQKQNISGNDFSTEDLANHESFNSQIDASTNSDCEDIKKVEIEGEDTLSQKEVSVLVKSRKGRGPQRTPKKFPWSLVPIVCSECKTRYSTYSTLRRHWTKCHSVDKNFDRMNPPKLMLCTVCDETFNWPRQFLKHYREHAAREEISIDKVQPVKFIGERTDFACDKLAPITCSICKMVINGEGVIYSHWKKEHKTERNEKPPPLFYCDQCELSFDAPRKYRLHYRMHTGAKPHECEECDKSFRTFSDLTAHMLCHNQSKEFKCEVCSKSFIQQKILNRHMKGHLFPHICNVCGKSYPSKYSLSLHSKIHTGEKPHKCEFCGVAFIQAGSLKLHRRLHLGDKPHVCETCGMRFNSMSHLRTHIRVHTGEKPYKCDKCNYAAASSSRLKDHATVHREDKPHVCKVPGCGRRYKRLSHLIFHHSKHAGVKPYVCKICGAAFKLSSELSLHKRQDACALHLKEEFKPDIAEDPPKENITDYSVIQYSQEDGIDTINNEEVKEETQTVYIFHNVEGQDGFQEFGDAGQQIIGMDEGATHAEFKLEGHVEGQEGFEQQIVIQIVREPGHEDEDVVLSKEELERIVRLSQQI